MFDPLHKWLGIPPSEQPPNHYRLLGITLFESDPEVIDAAADRQLAFLHGLANGEHAELAEEISNQVSRARIQLLVEQKKSEYDDSLRGLQTDSTLSSTADAQPTAPLAPTAPRADEATDSPQVTTPHVQRPPQPQEPRHDTVSTAWRLSVVPGLLLIAVLVGAIVIAKLWLDPNHTNHMEAVGGPDDVADTITDPHESDSAIADTENGVANSPAPQPEFASSSEHPTSWPQPQIAETQPQTSHVTLLPQPNAPAAPPVSPPDIKPQPGSTDQNSFVDSMNLPEPDLDEIFGPPFDPLPTVSQVKQKMAAVRELYEQQYRSSKTRRQKLDLANEMLWAAEKAEDDPHGQFAMMRVARDIFIGEDDFDQAMRAVRKIKEHFPNVDEVKLKSETLGAIKSVSLGRAKDYIDQALEVSTESIEAGYLDKAESLIGSLKAVVSSGIPPTRTKAIRDLRLDLENARSLFGDYQSSAVALESDPANQPASTSVGQYLCFVENHWDVGIAYLAVGSDPALRKAASLEANMHATNTPQLDVADAWYDAAKKTKGPLEKRRIRIHAVSYYESARATSTKIEAVKIERRLKEISPSFSSDKSESTRSRRRPSSRARKDARFPVTPELIQQRTWDSADRNSDFASISPGPIIKMGVGLAFYGEAAAGLEIRDATKMRIEGTGINQSHSKKVTDYVIGFFVDYHTDAGYTKRVFLQVMSKNTTRFTGKPDWGCGTEPHQVVIVGTQVRYLFDLTKWAPDKWDGRFWFSAYMKNSQSARDVKIPITWAR